MPIRYRYIFRIIVFIGLFSAFLAIVVLALTPDQNKAFQASSDTVMFSRIEHSIYSDNHRALGVFEYEKPYIHGNSEAVMKINEYFAIACEAFFNGPSGYFGEDAFRRIKNLFYQEIEQWGEERLYIQPFLYTAETKLTYISEDYVSFCQTFSWAATGPRDTWNQGLTFSMKNGNLVSFTEFYDVDPNLFKENLCGVLLALFDEFPLIKDELLNIYGANYNNSFEIVYSDDKTNIDMDYFYDGRFIYLTLNIGLFPHDGLVIQWDGKRDYAVENKSPISESP